MRLNDDGRTVAAMDVLAPGIGEIIGGSQREERLDILDARMAQFGLDPAHYGWYRDFRRYGTVPHAGFGLGFERLVVYVCGLANIRDAIPTRARRARGVLKITARLGEGAFLKPKALWWLLRGDYYAAGDRNLSGLATPSRISLLVILGGIAMGGVLWIIGQAMA
jgi:hypothetical protein